MMHAYCTSGNLQEALHLFEDMVKAGIALTEFTYSIILKVVADTSKLELGKHIHQQLKVPCTNQSLHRNTMGIIAHCLAQS